MSARDPSPLTPNPSPRFEVVATCETPFGVARAGVLRTPHGEMDTPVFMPVGTQGSVKGLTQQMLETGLDARIILANTYHLFIRPGHALVAQMGGLHRFLGWPRAILSAR